LPWLPNPGAILARLRRRAKVPKAIIGKTSA
jgi:hypothetical protein